VTWGCRGKTSAGYEAVEGFRPVLESFEPVADEGLQAVQGDHGEVGQAALDVSPHALDRVEVGRVGGQQEHRQPCPCVDQLSHGSGDMGVEPVPDRHDRCLDELVGAVEQRDEVALAHTAALALARGVGDQPMTQSGP
jgi:hypothetical protein